MYMCMCGVVGKDLRSELYSNLALWACGDGLTFESSLFARARCAGAESSKWGKRGGLPELQGACASRRRGRLEGLFRDHYALLLLLLLRRGDD